MTFFFFFIEVAKSPGWRVSRAAPRPSRHDIMTSEHPQRDGRSRSQTQTITYQKPPCFLGRGTCNASISSGTQRNSTQPHPLRVQPRNKKQRGPPSPQAKPRQDVPHGLPAGTQPRGKPALPRNKRPPPPLPSHLEVSTEATNVNISGLAARTEARMRRTAEAQNHRTASTRTRGGG